jgi:hypothetical protein
MIPDDPAAYRTAVVVMLLAQVRQLNHGAIACGEICKLPSDFPKRLQ